MPIADTDRNLLRKSKSPSERVFAVAGDWAVGADSLQWILYRRKGRDAWRGVSFVSSTRDILARCMREKGTDAATAAQLLAGLPETFNEWRASQDTQDAPEVDR